MKARDMANVLLKLLGVYWFVQGVILLLQGSMMPFMGLQDIEGFNWKMQMTTVLLYAALYAIASYFFIFRTSSVLRIIALDEVTAGSADPNSQGSHGPLAFALLGAFFAIPAFGHVLSGLIKYASQWHEAGSTYGMFKQSMMMNVMPDLASNAAKLIIGIVLILGQNKLLRLWKWLRPLIADKTEEN